MNIWNNEVDFIVTACDKKGIIVGMNKKSIEFFAEDGGPDLIGKSLLDCHPEPAKSKLVDLLANPRPNTYISKSSTVNLFVHETPWYKDGKYMGFVELLIELPESFS